MTQTRDIAIIKNLSALIEVARAYKRCGQYSIENPTTPLNQNPYEPETRRLHRRAFGSTKVLWGCSHCRYMFPLVTADIHSECCDAELFFNDHRPRKQREAK